MGHLNINYEKMWTTHKEYIRERLDYYKKLLNDPKANTARKYVYQRKHDILTEVLINMNDTEIQACHDKINENILHTREALRNILNNSEDDGE